ncbi:TrxA Thiol-disulfide isomerase and thioredoxins [uncultured Caudovirales phage]|uniref:TrxA Thiol-disulfide isomerase and thioredoxins n=1 Tax=uncultured Caudovirales phage TaxID=2100421 RepID=A0A6J5RXR1_9CAUD|nr:TrxA Thiol-disulfide isomerase and thioredoxins [uncultured Caudovirales phage]
MIFISEEKDLNFQSKITLVYFYASWMPFNKRMLNLLKNIENKYSDIVFFAVDVDYFKAFCKRFSVNSIPEIIIFVDGNEKCRINGIVFSSALKKAINDIL